jgi:hypothetical protein
VYDVLLVVFKKLYMYVHVFFSYFNRIALMNAWETYQDCLQERSWSVRLFFLYVVIK